MGGWNRPRCLRRAPTSRRRASPALCIGGAGYDAVVSTLPDMDGAAPVALALRGVRLRPGLVVSAGDTARLACAVRFGCLEVLSAEVLSSE